MGSFVQRGLEGRWLVEALDSCFPSSDARRAFRILCYAYPSPYVSPQNDDDFEAIPGTQFVVSRTAHRSNKSDYFIDGRKSNFTEVTTLLKGKGIDLDNNRFLILQVEGDGWAGDEGRMRSADFYTSNRSTPPTRDAGRGGADQHDEAQGPDRARNRALGVPGGHHRHQPFP